MSQTRQAPLALVVDDDRMQRLLVKQALEQRGYRVEEVDDGNNALLAFDAAPPDIVLLDVVMPGMDGYAVCRKLRKLPRGKQIPILMMTGLDDVESVEQAFEAGATDFITKPIHWPLLPHRVRYLLRTAEALDKLAKSEQRLAHAQRLAHLGNWEWDIEGGRFNWSDELYRIVGVELLAYTPDFELLLGVAHPDDRKSLQEAMHSALKTGQGTVLEHRLLLRDGTQKVVLQQWEVVTGADGVATQVRGTVQDITERKEQEAMIARLRSDQMTNYSEVGNLDDKNSPETRMK